MLRFCCFDHAVLLHLGNGSPLKWLSCMLIVQSCLSMLVSFIDMLEHMTHIRPINAVRRQVIAHSISILP